MRAYNMCAYHLFQHRRGRRPMWTYSHSLETPASADAIFALYADVASWPRWDSGLERLELDGPFASATEGTMFLFGQEPLRMRLKSVTPGRGFEDETPLPDAGVVVRARHCLEPLGQGGTRITHIVNIDGPGADALGPTIGPAI